MKFGLKTFHIVPSFRLNGLYLQSLDTLLSLRAHLPSTTAANTSTAKLDTVQVMFHLSLPVNLKFFKLDYHGTSWVLWALWGQKQMPWED